jgi:hypothetical protein
MPMASAPRDGVGRTNRRRRSRQGLRGSRLPTAPEPFQTGVRLRDPRVSIARPPPSVQAPPRSDGDRAGPSPLLLRPLPRAGAHLFVLRPRQPLLLQWLRLSPPERIASPGPAPLLPLQPRRPRQKRRAATALPAPPQAGRNGSRFPTSLPPSYCRAYRRGDSLPAEKGGFNPCRSPRRDRARSRSPHPAPPTPDHPL